MDHAAGPLGDLHAFDPAAMAWTDLSAAASGTPPSPRDFHGLASAGGLLYVFGGWDGAGGCLLESPGEGLNRSAKKGQKWPFLVL